MNADHSDEDGEETASIEWTGERFVPWVDLGAPEIHYEHLHRYYFASQFVSERQVLDLASGEGYGCAILARGARRVVGVEIDEKAVKHAATRYRLPNVEFLQGSISAVPIDGEKRFDVITCFEALEHIKEQSDLLTEVARLLKDDGLLIISSPNKLVYSDQPGYQNPFHVKELYFDEFRKLLVTRFRHVRFLGQRVFPVSSIWVIGQQQGGHTDFCIRKADDQFVQAPILDKLPLFFIAVASQVPLPDDAGFSTLTDLSEELLNRLRQTVEQQAQSLGGLLPFDEEQQSRPAPIAELAERELLISSLKTEAADNQRALVSIAERLAESEQSARSLRAQLEAEREQLKQQVAGKDLAIDALNAETAYKDEATRMLASRLAQKEQAALALVAQLSEEQEKSISTEQLIVTLRLEAAKSEREIRELSSRLNEKGQLELNFQAEMKAERLRLTRQLEGKDLAIAMLNAQLGDTDQRAKTLSSQLAAKEKAIEALSIRLADTETQIRQITSTLGWRLLNNYGRRIKYPYLLPLYRFYGRIKYPYLLPLYRLLGLSPSALDANTQQSKQEKIPQAKPAAPPPSQTTILVKPVPAAVTFEAHGETAEIIICVHNALEDVKRCLESVTRCTNVPYSLMLVDDGSNEETRKYLSDFSGAGLIRNEQAKGYTLAANQGLRQSRGDYVVLLNSDTVVTHGWLRRMIACGESDSRIGLVGPLSNAASWQSIPEMIQDRDFAQNELPEGLTVESMGELVAKYSGRLYPRIPFLNGFCLAIKRKVIEDIGYFDEEIFGRGYGEENDYCLRARKAGWQLAIAEDVYIHHLQSRSYSHERRKELSSYADAALVKKHGRREVDAGVTTCRFDRVMEGIRARSQVMGARQRFIEQGKVLWQGKRVLFVLPVSGAGGGGNVVLDEAEAMRKMGVDATILNLSSFRRGFEKSYPDNTIPVNYVSKGTDLSELLPNYDAVIATWCASVDWLADPNSDSLSTARGYYVQDFEPYFFYQGSAEFTMARNSYTRFGDLVRITKTEWNREIVKSEIGVESVVVGPSVNIDLYRPRNRQNPSWPQRPLRIAAMIRPSSPRRAPKLTLEILRDLYFAHGDSIEIVLFGCHSADLSGISAPNDLSYRLAGVLTRSQIAALLNEVDIFVDFSTYQAMGLTAMEAMACGAAVIVPQRGGSASFAKHEENAIVVNTNSRAACLRALERLITDENFRTRLQRAAVFDICQFFPEKPAFNILSALFQESRHRDSGPHTAEHDATISLG